MKKAFGFISGHKEYFIALLAIVVIALAAMVVFLTYYSHLHIDYNDITAIYGVNGASSSRFEFDDATVSAVRDCLNNLSYNGTDKGNTDIYTTFVCVEMSDGTQYRFKYYDADTVYIVAGAKRIGRYKCDGDLTAITKALESKYGIGANGYTI